MILDGFRISGYRSFGALEQEIRDLGKVNVFIGKNNSGKSNILRFVERLSQLCESDRYGRGKEKPLFDPLHDLHKGTAPCDRINFSLLIDKNSAAKTVVKELFEKLFPQTGNLVDKWQDGVWIPYSIVNLHNGERQFDVVALSELLKKSYSASQIARAQSLDGWQGGTRESQLEHVAKKFDVLQHCKFVVSTIPAYRKITAEPAEWELNGRGLIQKLNMLKNPVVGREEDQGRFRDINQFLRDILGKPEANIDIPHSVDDLYVEFDNRRLPIESLGTGIHQVILLAIAVTLIENAVVCIEEPEIYLHPELQKKFINYICEKTKNQYLVTTHSNAIFDCPKVNIFHCALENGCTKVEKVRVSSQKHLILDELGYRASDILQSNCIIWVEGPSDRIYLNKWISDRDPQLREGIEYSIMFYGGRLLNHLSVDDEAVKDFISLSRMNRNVALVMDSDKRYSRQPLNDTKKRIIDEFAKIKGVCWVTKGRQIENYVSPLQLVDSVKLIHGSECNVESLLEFDDVTKYVKNGKEQNIDKIRMAKEIAAQPADFSVLDLAKKLDEIILFIRSANGLMSLKEND
jgi:predicted ATPase